MAAEDETPRGALACLHTTEGGEGGGRQLREGRGTPGLSQYKAGWAAQSAGLQRQGRGEVGRGRKARGKAATAHTAGYPQTHQYRPRLKCINPQIQRYPPAD